DEFLVRSCEPVARTAWRAPRGLASVKPSPALLEGMPIDRSVSAISALRGGTAEARRRLTQFVRTRLNAYDRERNHPEHQGTSQLSPYLHFGHIGPREVALAVRDCRAAGTAVFLEQ